MQVAVAELVAWFAQAVYSKIVFVGGVADGANRGRPEWRRRLSLAWLRWIVFVGGGNARDDQ